MVELSLREEIEFCCGTCADKVKMKEGYDELLELAYLLASNYQLSETFMKAKVKLLEKFPREV